LHIGSVDNPELSMNKNLGNERGAVLVFVTLIIVLLLVMIGMGLDTGQLTYVRSQGQSAVDAAALAAASAVPTNSRAQVDSRVAGFNSTNTYVDSPNNLLGTGNVTLVKHDGSTFTKATVSDPATTGDANGVRVALETNNPYDAGATATPMKSPLFLTPLFNLFGASTPTTANVSVSAVAIVKPIPGMPVVIGRTICDAAAGGTKNDVLLLTDNQKVEQSGWTSFYVDSANAKYMKAMVANNKTCDSIPAIDFSSPGCINLNNGDIASLRQEIADVYAPFSSPPNSDDCFFIPVVDDTTGGNTFLGCKAIYDWARICISEVQTKSNPKYVKANVTCGQNPLTTRDTKCYTPVLVRDKQSGM
jgi:Flp pilus assembly protein TadG